MTMEKHKSVADLVLHYRDDLLERKGGNAVGYKDSVAGNRRFDKVFIVQYWSQETVPAEILTSWSLWDEYLKNVDSLEIIRFSRESAFSWLNENDPGLAGKFLRAVHPAMESDILRVAFAMKHPAVWLDSDHVPPAEHSKGKFGLADFEAWARLKHGAYLIKQWDKKTPFVNNSIFRASPDCPVMIELRKRILALDPAAHDTADLLANFAGPKAYTEVISNLIENRLSSIEIDDNHSVVLKDDKGAVLCELGRLFRLVGARTTYPDLFKSDDWEYKQDKKMNWQSL